MFLIRCARSIVLDRLPCIDFAGSEAMMRSDAKITRLFNSTATLLLLCTCLLWLSCSDTDDTAAIRRLIAKGADLAEAHDIGGIMDLATRDMRAMPGDLNRRAVKGVLWNAFNHYGPLKVLYPRAEVEVAQGATRASARFPFVIVRKEQTIPGLEALADDPLAWLKTVGDNADVYRLTLQFAKQRGGWAVDRACLERFSGIGFEE